MLILVSNIFDFAIQRGGEKDDRGTTSQQGAWQEKRR